jgi:hypothetical protein
MNKESLSNDDLNNAINLLYINNPERISQINVRDMVALEEIALRKKQTGLCQGFPLFIDSSVPKNKVKVITNKKIYFLDIK